MNKSIYPWQKDLWSQMQSMRSSLPHAFLFHGPAGIGKTAFAERFAQSLLCENLLPDGHACGHCTSCGWFLKYSHPDYRRIRPESLETGDADAEEADDEGGADESGGKSKRAPSKIIRIAQVRALADFVNISTHRNGYRIVLLYPAESLNAESSNALLKTLEEPSPGTVFLLIADRPESLLPTILSRCRKVPIAMPARELSIAWMREQGIKDPEVWLAEQGGAPLAACELAQAENREEMEAFLGQLARPSVDSALKVAERMQKMPNAQMITWLQRWLYDIFSLKFTGVVRYYPRYKRELSALAERMDAGALLRMIKSTSSRQLIAEHPLAPRLFVEDMLLEYLELYA